MCKNRKNTNAMISMFIVFNKKRKRLFEIQTAFLTKYHITDFIL